MLNIALSFFCLLIPSIVFHEYAHAWVADRLGDDTARRMGRLTLNPLRHVDPFGTVILPLLLYIPYVIGLTHSPLIFGFAKPVPFNPARLRDPRRGIMLVRLAGPLMNMLMACVVAKGLVFVHNPYLIDLGVTAVYINIGLALFNMIPIPPLDGSGILYAILPARMLALLQRVDNIVGMILVFVMFKFGWFSFVNVMVYKLAQWMGVQA
ncbi:MAG: site-2 protease family protein [Candidatus Omnitrophota bacterium]